MKAKFKAGDKVKIVANELQPQFVNQVGIIKKAFQTTDKEQIVYRVMVGSVTLKGVAIESDLEAV